jgi:acylphosphatase
MERAMDQKAITATVTGRVQGVGYRYTAASAAEELGLVGWVRNAPEGSVETWAQGDEEALERFVAFLRKGPRLASVRSVDVLSVDPDPLLQTFAVRF